MAKEIAYIQVRVDAEFKRRLMHAVVDARISMSKLIEGLLMEWVDDARAAGPTRTTREQEVDAILEEAGVLPRN